MLTTSAAARIADRPRAPNEQNAVLVDLELRVVDAVVIVLGPLEYDRPTLERVRVLRVGEEAGAELLIDHARLHDRVVEQIAAPGRQSPRPLSTACRSGMMTSGSSEWILAQFSPIVLPLTVSAF